MEVIIQPSPGDASTIAARIIAKRIKEKPNMVLGLATGSTPERMYAELIRLHQQEGLDFSHVTTFNLDEYLGLPQDHPQSYYTFMQETLFKHINIPPDQINIPCGTATDVPEHCRAYEARIAAAGGIDIQVLGIGSDGHLGFNEPTSSLASRTRIKTLTEETRNDNARFFNDIDEVPIHCITMGMGTILDSRTCLMLAFGTGKARAVFNMIEGPVSAMCPGSALQMHPNVHVLIDEPAAETLSRKGYYHWVYENKPAWQRH